MTDSHPPHGGQPDPNLTPSSGPPARQGGYGQPGQPARFTAPLPPPQRSNKRRIIGLCAAAVVLLFGVGFVLLNDEDRTPRAASSEPGTDVTPTPPASDPGDNAVTARYTEDFGNVCEGRPISNAAPHSGASGAKAYVFTNSPDRPAAWSSASIASNRPYYAENMKSVSVVGCVEFVGGGEGTPLECKYTGTGQRITIDYTPSRYKLTFYAAKTAEKIGDGGTVSTPANRCPTFISSYNKNTMTAYASPDTAAIAAAMEEFLS